MLHFRVHDHLFPVFCVFSSYSTMAAKRKAFGAEKVSEVDSSKTRDDREERARKRALIVSIQLFNTHQQD